MAPQTTTKGLDLSKPVGFVPGRLDVVSFRGGRTNNHFGSKMWRAMVDERKLDYLYAKTQRQKRAIVLDCIREHESKGGRYVGEYHGKYYVNTPEKAYHKTIQRLREGNTKKFLQKIEQMVLPPAPLDAKDTEECDLLTNTDMQELCNLFLAPPKAENVADKPPQQSWIPFHFHPIDAVECVVTDEELSVHSASEGSLSEDEL